MAIKTKLNSSDEYIGEMQTTVNGETIRVNKVITKVNGVKKTIYRYIEDPVKFTGYLLLMSNENDTSEKRVFYIDDFEQDTFAYLLRNLSPVPSIIASKKTFYVFQENANECVYTSRDLENWTTHNYTFTTNAISSLSGVMKHNGVFYCFGQTRINGTQARNWQIYLMISQNGYNWNCYLTNLHTLIGAWQYNGAIVCSFGFVKDGSGEYIVVDGYYNNGYSSISYASIDTLPSVGGTITFTKLSEDMDHTNRMFVCINQSDHELHFSVPCGNTIYSVSVNNGQLSYTSFEGYMMIKEGGINYSYIDDKIYINDEEIENSLSNPCIAMIPNKTNTGVIAFTYTNNKTYTAYEVSSSGEISLAGSFEYPSTTSTTSKLGVGYNDSNSKYVCLDKV